ncbi:MAG: UTRA domain-containing protein [Bermanella sp.]
MIPAYIKIRDYLSQQIAKGVIPIHSKLPSERELVEQFSTTRITAREALSKLEAAGVIYRSNRRGWFVCPARLNYDPSSRVNFYQLAQEQGRQAGTHVLKIKKVKGPADIRQQFNLKSTEKLVELSRVRFLELRPVLFEKIYLPESLVPDLSQRDLNGSLTQILKQDYGHVITQEDNQIKVEAIYDDQAHELQLNDGSPCLNIHRKRYAKNGVLIEYDIEYWVHSAIELVISSR